MRVQGVEMDECEWGLYQGVYLAWVYQQGEAGQAVEFRTPCQDLGGSGIEWTQAEEEGGGVTRFNDASWRWDAFWAVVADMQDEATVHYFSLRRVDGKIAMPWHEAGAMDWSEVYVTVWCSEDDSMMGLSEMDEDWMGVRSAAVWLQLGRCVQELSRAGWCMSR